MKLVLTFFSALFLVAILVGYPSIVPESLLPDQGRAPDRLVTPAFWILDSADILTPEQEGRLNGMLSELNRRTTIQMIGVTIDSIGGASIEEYSLRIASDLGIGVDGVNNGVMIVVAPNQRQVRIEVGRGMEWQISDSTAATVVDEMTPHFRQGDYNGALEAAFRRIALLNKDIPWTIGYESIPDVLKDGARAVGKIVRFEGMITEIDSTAARIESWEGRSLRMLFTPYTDLSPAGLQPDTRRLFHGRVVSVDPLVLQLLGGRSVE